VFHARLAALAFRRVLPWPVALVLCALLGWAALRGGSAPWLGSGEESLLRAARRLDVWGLALVIAGPLVLLRAGLVGDVQRNEWLAPASAAGVALSHLAGVLLAVLSVVLATALAAEVAAGSAPPTWRAERRFTTPAGALFPDQPVRWEEPALVREPRATVRLRLSVTVAPGSGPAATLRFRAHTSSDDASVERRVAGRAHLELEVGVDGDPPELELASVGEGALPILLPDGLEELVAVASEREQSAALALRALGALGAAALLALGLSGWMRPAFGAGVAVTLSLVPLAIGPGGRWFPAGDLAQAWSEVAAGLAPAWPTASTWLGALCAVFAGFTLHASSLIARRERP